MQDDQFIVPCGDDILLEVIGSHGERQGLGLDRMFGQVARGTAMRNDDRSHKLL